tara:strand:+ start:91 stop:498 length:408 start_codon:yes stop_codon:yes gene_type:complete
MSRRVITQVTLENFHELVPEYIQGNNIIIQNYEDTKDIYLSMLRDNYLFTFDRDILIACLTDLTYMYAPGDDLNKDAVIELLVLEGEEEEEEEGEEEEEEEEVVEPVDRSLDVTPDIIQSVVSTVSDTEECTSGM